MSFDRFTYKQEIDSFLTPLANTALGIAMERLKLQGGLEKLGKSYWTLGAKILNKELEALINQELNKRGEEDEKEITSKFKAIKDDHDYDEFNVLGQVINKRAILRGMPQDTKDTFKDLLDITEATDSTYPGNLLTTPVEDLKNLTTWEIDYIVQRLTNAVSTIINKKYKGKRSLETLETSNREWNELALPIIMKHFSVDRGFASRILDNHFKLDIDRHDELIRHIEKLRALKTVTPDTRDTFKDLLDT